ncbi:unnamed protein product [Acanthoscelides obtectus]|uniref:Uncharacterized protein n=1 Tax=Acanthoscelides obtectus TaxID=200917 RepID=A0A9P0MCZ1_ACAOB|nr:unnamed protein product [Acanthoscelides obtectus]CAK1678357.1 Protein slit [Acanthoscelides obtectus]
MKFIILLGSLLSLAEACPSSCECTSSTVSCIQKNLQHIPNFNSIQLNPMIIDLSGNKINSITDEDFTFDRNIAIAEIYLNNSEVLDIDGEAFVELENLQELYLGENLLHDIPQNIIEDLPNMILLELSSNLFSGDLPLIKSKSLEVLALANCKISSVPEHALKLTPNLKMLLLQRNNIKYISQSTFTGITRSFALKLFYNKFECSCKTFQLFDFLGEHEYVDKSDPYRCSNTTDTDVDIFDKKIALSFHNICTRSNRIPKIQATSLKSNDLTLRSEKSYSLIQENKVEQHDEGVSSKKEALQNNSDIVEISKKTTYIITLDKNFFEVVVICCVFFLGLFAGFSLNRFVTTYRYIKFKRCSENQMKLYTP